MAKTKYKKLIGDEVAKPEDKLRADLFMVWYGQNLTHIKRCIKLPVDEDVLIDTALKIYDIIALKSTVIKDNLRYYLLAYKNVYVDKDRRVFESIENLPYTVEPDAEDNAAMQMYALREDMLNYVRGNYDTIAVSIFEIYVMCYPEMPVLKIVQLTGMPKHRINQTLTAIAEDLKLTYGAQYRRYSII